MHPSCIRACNKTLLLTSKESRTTSQQSGKIGEHGCMEYASVVFVGGFGASTNFAERMCVELQRLLSRKVYNFSLLHGCTLEEECAREKDYLRTRIF